MAEYVPVDLAQTGGRLLPPGTTDRPPELPAPAAAAPPAQAAPPPADAPHKNCHHCGWPYGLDPAEPDAGDAARFVQAVFRGRPYAKTVELYDGAVSVTFRWLTAEEEDGAHARLEAEKAAGAYQEPFPTGQVKAAERLSDLRLGCAVERLRVGDAEWTRPPATDPDAARQSLRAACASAPVWDAVRWEFQVFMTQLARLRANARNPSFYRATPAGGPSPGPRPPATPVSVPPPGPGPARKTG